MSHITVSEAARLIPGAKPKDISTLLYIRALDDERCPIIGGRRMIPLDYLDGIAIELRRAGKLPRKQVANVR